MSELSYMDKLLDGIEVEWKTLDEIAIKISSGGTPLTSMPEYYDGDIPWLRTQEVNFDEIWDTGVKITEAGLKNSSAKLIPENCVIIAMYGATVGKIGINKIPMATNQACANIFLDEAVANYRYVFHFLHSQYEYIKSLGSGSQTNINAGIVKKLQIPIPPLKIQAEIVRILDAFTELTAELVAVLTAELVARKQQYAYYREQLLTFKESKVEWKKLEELCEKISSGKNKVKSELGLYPVFGSTGIIGRTDTKVYEKEQILVARVGANAGRINIAKGEYDVSDNTLIVQNKENIILKFLYYYLVNINLNRFTKGAGQPLLTAGQLKTMLIPLPTLAEQQRIVTILDKFDALTTSLAEGLPHEIALRQQQYEYYRELLLSFPKVEDNV